MTIAGVHVQVPPRAQKTLQSEGFPFNQWIDLKSFNPLVILN